MRRCVQPEILVSEICVSIDRHTYVHCGTLDKNVNVAYDRPKREPACPMSMSCKMKRQIVYSYNKVIFSSENLKTTAICNIYKF